MKLVTLNTWGGKLLEPLLSFVKERADGTDIFCFQEMYSSSVKKIIARNMYSQLLEELSVILKDFQVYYSPHLKNRDIDQDTDFELSTGLATFIRKTIKVKEWGEIDIYRSGYKLIDGNYQTIPKNLQYFAVSNNRGKYLIGNFHGIWYPHDKLDTEDRLEQSEIIRNFLQKRPEKIVLCGDYNLLPDTKSMLILDKDLRNLIKLHAVKKTRSELHTGTAKITDYILVSSEVEVKDFKVINTTVSDHLPLYIEFI